jgi:hypothetical protein
METPGFVAFLSGQERYKDLTFLRMGVRVIYLVKISKPIGNLTIWLSDN